MRSRFTELIDSGIAKSNYVNTITNFNQDPICTLYNNLYSISTDTTMRPYEDGYIITGHIRSKCDFDKVCGTCNAGRISGYCNIYDFFSQHRLCGSFSTVNNDNAYILKLYLDGQNCRCEFPCSPGCYYEGASRIPHHLKELTTNGDVNKIIECFKSTDVIKNLNESLYVKGNKWFIYDNKVYGEVGGKVITII